MAGAFIQAVDGRYLTPVLVSFNNAGANAIVAGSPGVIIRCYRMILVATAAITVQFQDGSNNLSGVMSLPLGAQFILPFDGTAWYTTSAGNAFNINTTAVQISGTAYVTTTAPSGL